MMTEQNAAGDAQSPPSKRAVGRSAKTKLTEVVVVCAKCAKRQGLRPRAVRALLKKAGKQAGRDTAGGRRKLCVVESGCLGPCPKRAIAVATGASLAAGRVILLDPGAEPAAALAAILHPVLSRRPAPEFGPNTALAPVSPDESPPRP